MEVSRELKRFFICQQSAGILRQPLIPSTRIGKCAGYRRFALEHTMNAMTDKEKAYLAGLIDGEGCIFISKSEGRKQHKSPEYTLRVIINMTSESTIRRCQETTGIGRVYCQNRSRDWRRENHSDQWSWVASQREAYAVLLQIRDYLYLKKCQADTAIEFINLGSLRNGKYGIVNQHIIEERERLRLLLMDQKITDSKRAGYISQAPKPRKQEAEQGKLF